MSYESENSLSNAQILDLVDAVRDVDVDYNRKLIKVQKIIKAAQDAGTLETLANAQDAHGWSALHYAARDQGKVSDEILHLILKIPNCKIDILEHNGWTPLHIASILTNPNVAKILLQHTFSNYGINGLNKLLSTQSIDGKTAANVAREEVKTLFRDIQVKIRTMESGESDVEDLAIFLGGQNPQLLINTVKEQNLIKVQKIIKAAQDAGTLETLANMKDHKGSSALHYTAEKAGEVADKISDAILDIPNCPIDILNKNKSTPLHIAALYGNEALCKKLIILDADVNAQNDDLIIPLHCAARKNEAAVAKLLLDNEADLYCANKGKWTPLHFACQYNAPDAAKVLLQHAFIKGGIDGLNQLLNMKNHFTKTAYTTAKEKKYQKIVSMLDELKQGLVTNDVAKINKVLRDNPPAEEAKALLTEEEAVALVATSVDDGVGVSASASAYDAVDIAGANTTDATDA